MKQNNFLIEYKDKSNSFIRVSLLPKTKRLDKKKIDGIRLEIKSPCIPNIKGIISPHYVCLDLTNWEVICIIHCLSGALLEKRFRYFKSIKNRNSYGIRKH